MHATKVWQYTLYSLSAYDRSIALPPPSCMVVNRRAMQPSVLAAKVMMLSWPVLLFWKFCRIWGTRALMRMMLLKSYAAVIRGTVTWPAGGAAGQQRSHDAGTQPHQSRQYATQG